MKKNNCFKLRYANLSDVEEISALDAKTWAVTYSSILEKSFLDRRNLKLRQKWKKVICESIGITILCTFQNKICGYAVIMQNRDEDLFGTDIVEMAALYVDPETHRSGVGSKLWNAVIKYCQDHQKNGISLWVLEQNKKARKFYLAQGTRKDGRSRNRVIGKKQLVELRYIFIFE